MNFAYAFSSVVCDIVFAGIFILLGIAIRLAGLLIRLTFALLKLTFRLLRWTVRKSVKCYKSYKTRKSEKVLQNSNKQIEKEKDCRVPPKQACAAVRMEHGRRGAVGDDFGRFRTISDENARFVRKSSSGRCNARTAPGRGRRHLLKTFPD